jgi:hypothetical protein
VREPTPTPSFERQEQRVIDNEPRIQPATRDTDTIDVVVDQPMAVTPATTAASTAAATAAVQGLTNTGVAGTGSSKSFEPRYEESRGTSAGMCIVVCWAGL